MEQLVRIQAFVRARRGPTKLLTDQEYQELVNALVQARQKLQEEQPDAAAPYTTRLRPPRGKSKLPRLARLFRTTEERREWLNNAETHTQRIERYLCSLDDHSYIEWKFACAARVSRRWMAPL